MDEDIEVLDIFDNKIKKTKDEVSLVKKEEKKEGSSKSDMKRSSGKKKRKIKAKAFQALFCMLSALFIIGCIIFYGSRFIKYYRIYNPKIDSSNGNVLLAKDIIGKTEYDTTQAGLYNASGNYFYKGKVEDNYLKYNNMLWRIVKINIDNSIDIILDDYINLLPWNSKLDSFKNTDIYQYLNNDFISKLNKDLLVPTSFCEDEINDLSKMTCEKVQNDSYVRLLDVAGFLNSVKNKETYLVNKDDIFWLNDQSSDKVWHTNGYNVSQSAPNTFYEIRPMVKLKNTVTYTKGDGTISNPYIVDDEKKLTVGSVVQLGEDRWFVYNIDKEVQLMSSRVLDSKKIYDKKNYDYSESSLKEYLNTTYLDSLTYKDKIVSSDWYVGEYNDSIEDIKKEKVNAKVGIPNIIDIHFNSSVNGYYTSTTNNENVWTYENPLRPSRITTERNVRPCISISKDFADKLVYNGEVFKED